MSSPPAVDVAGAVSREKEKKKRSRLVCTDTYSTKCTAGEGADSRATRPEACAQVTGAFVRIGCVIMCAFESFRWEWAERVES